MNEPGSAGQSHGAQEIPSGRTIQREVTIRAGAEAVWRAWTRPEGLAGWFAEWARGRGTPGSALVLGWDQFGVEATWRVLEADAPRRLVLASEGPHGGPELLEITIRHRGGETVLRLVHSGFAPGPETDEVIRGVDSGWEIAFAILKVYLERYPRRSRSELFLMRTLPYDPQRLEAYYADPERLSRWLTRSGGPGAVGESFGMVLRDGRRMSGQVLAAPGPELALTWDEIEGVLELKAFPYGAPDDSGQVPRAFGIRVSTWRAGGVPKGLRKELDGALGRLEAELRSTGSDRVMALTG